MSAFLSSPRHRAPADKLTRRKRTSVACQFCRIRKTRCDGVRPVCGFCRHHDAQCVWGIGSEDEGYEGTPAEREILQRLEEIKQFLHGSNRITNSLSPGHELLDAVSGIPKELPSSPEVVHSQERYLPTTASVSSPYAFARCETMLRWPIFEGLVDPADASIDSFVLEYGFDITSPYPVNTGSGILEQQFVPLCRKFLAHVHPRNPILEGSELIRHAKHAAEDGLGWDAASCLVVRTTILNYHSELTL